MTPRIWAVLVFVLVVSVTGGLLVTGDYMGSRRALKGVQASLKASAERERAVEARVEAVSDELATALDALSAAEVERQVAKEGEARAVAEMAKRAAEVAKPVAPSVRARRVQAAIPDSAEGDVVPATRGSRPGFWVAARQFEVMEEALALRPALEDALVSLRDQRAHLEKKVVALDLVVKLTEKRAQEWEVAYHDAEAAGAGLVSEGQIVRWPWWAWAGAGLAVGIVSGVAIASAIDSPGVTIVR